MSNRICMTKTVFQDINTNGSQGDISWGYRIHDDYGSTYNNMITQEQFNRMSAIEFAQYAFDNGDEVSGAMFEFLLEMEDSYMYVGDETISIKEIEDV